jgi:hypothetical protein
MIAVRFATLVGFSALLTVCGGTICPPPGEPKFENHILSLRQIAPPGLLTQAFAVDWSAGCTS